MKQECAERQRVDRHFEGTLPSADEHAMREHLPACAICTARYERHLLLAELDPAALGAEERIGRGLGIGKPAPRWTRWAGPAAALAMAAAVLLVLGLRGMKPPDSGFTARGGRPSAGEAAGSSIIVYRAAARAKPSRAGDSIGARDELAFAYDNASAKRYLVIFGIDEHRHVFWYHPGWSNPADDPTSIAIETTPGVHHLHEAIAHDLDGQKLEIHALFTDAPLSVKTVERLVVTETPQLATAYAPGAKESVLRLEVSP
jgi:hypothetical protein